MFVRSTLPTDAIRREILSALRTSDAMTVPRATAHVAAVWSGRRRRQGECTVRGRERSVDRLPGRRRPRRRARRPAAVGGQALRSRPPRGSAAPHPAEATSMSDHVTWEPCLRCADSRRRWAGCPSTAWTAPPRESGRSSSTAAAAARSVWTSSSWPTPPWTAHPRASGWAPEPGLGTTVRARCTSRGGRALSQHWVENGPTRARLWGNGGDHCGLQLQLGLAGDGWSSTRFWTSWPRSATTA